MTIDNAPLNGRFANLSTPLIADACIRLKLGVRAADAGIHPVRPEMKIAGRVLPAHHRGSVDIFLEAMKNSKQNDILVIDNEGRTDEACIGDLTVLEAQASGLAGLVVNGLHRDTSELVQIGFPVFSYGTIPVGPQHVRQRKSTDLSIVQWADFTVDTEDMVFADSDGVVFVDNSKVAAVLDTAESIWKVERNQAESIKTGTTLARQFDFDNYLMRRKSNPSYTFRQHLRQHGGAIEE